MGRLLRIFLVMVLLAVIAIPTGLALFGLETQPLVSGTGGASLRDLGDADELARRLDPRRMSPQKITIVPARAADLDRLLAGSLHALGRVGTRVVVTRYGVVAGVTVEAPLPRNPVGRFVNLRLTIPPSHDGFAISRLAVGRIEAPSWIIRPALRFAFERLFGAGTGQKVLDSVRSVRIDDATVFIVFRPPPDLVSDTR